MLDGKVLFWIIKNTVNKIKKLNSNNKIFASIGPCIGKKVMK